ncbi:Lrp/AsnC family transcriptional regulator [Enterococcus gallinarum]|uniref:Lrp/AsnC family transcriptional regulator n=1 Tax=Enterococcus gallinarum TaxID=1353 RepID=UPI003D6BEA72
MDNLDRKILNIMQQNARVTVKQIAEQCFISSPSVSVRVQNLETLGYIRSYQALIDYQKLGYLIKEYVHCAVNAKDKEAFYAYIADIPNVIECDCITGDYSMLLKVYFSDTVVLDRFITDLQFYGDTKTHIVFSTNVGPRGLQVPVDDQ